jgi:hypothetical protein
MKRSVFVVFFLSFLSLNSIAQQEATWWYFGTNAGISFTELAEHPLCKPMEK